MIVKVKVNELKNRLRTIASLGNDKGLEALDYCILSSNGSVEVFGTDLTTSVKEHVEVISVEGKGRIAFPRKKMFEILSQLEEEVEIKGKNRQIQLLSGSSNFMLSGVNVEDFPTFPEIADADPVTLSAENLLEVINRTYYCTNNHDARYTLSCVLFHFKPGSLTLVGTDGHRLALMTADLEFEKEAKLLVSRESIVRLRQFLMSEEKDSRVIIMRNKSYMRIATVGREIVLRLVEGQFPDYESVLKGINNDKIINLKKDELISVLRQALVICKERTSTVCLRLRSRIIVVSTELDGNEVMSAIDTDYRGEEEFNVYLNAQFLLDAVTLCKNDITLMIKDALSAIDLRESDNRSYRHIIMPVRT